MVPWRHSTSGQWQTGWITQGTKANQWQYMRWLNLLGEHMNLLLLWKNIVSGFRTCGLFPINRDVFQEEDFLPSSLSGWSSSLDAEASQPPTLEIRTTSQTPASEDFPQNKEIILSKASSSLEASTDAPTPVSLHQFPREENRSRKNRNLLFLQIH